METATSRVFQPERYSFSSKDDQTTLASSGIVGFYDSFRIQLKIPILGIKSLELLRASVPCITPSLPDTELVFWYYRLPKQSGYDEPVPPSIEYLHCVRIQPSYVPTELLPVGYDFPVNHVYSNYSDLLLDLNKACLTDLNNPYFISGDISFNLTPSNKFSFSGNNIFGTDFIVVTGEIVGGGSSALQYFYSYAGYNDSNVEVAKAVLKNATQNNFGIQGLIGQPYYLGRTMNMRLGFCWSGEVLSQNDYRNHIRPVPNYFLGNPVMFDVPNYIAETYADLVYSANLNLYCNLIGGSAYDSTGRPDLLSIIPLNSGQLGVAFYNNVIPTPLSKVPREIYEVQFLLRTDSGDNYVLPDSAITNFEIKIGY